MGHSDISGGQGSSGGGGHAASSDAAGSAADSPDADQSGEGRGRDTTDGGAGSGGPGAVLPATEPAGGGRFAGWFRGIGAVYCAAALMSLSNGMLRVAQPHQMHDLGANDEETGRLGGIMQGCYLLGLFLLWPRFAHRDLQRTALMAAGVLVATTVALGLVGDRNLIQAVGAVHGAAACIYWPPLMGIAATGVAGLALARRLGTYNLMWSSALVIGPAAGGALVEHVGTTPVFLMGAGMTGLALACVAILRPPAADAVARSVGDKTSTDEPAAKPSPEETSHASVDPHRAAIFSGIGRLSVLGGYLAAGLVCWQFPALKPMLGMDALQLGLVMAGHSIAVLATFAVMRRTDRWHESLAFAVGIQLVLVVTLAGLWWVDSIAHLAVAAALAGMCTAAGYGNSIFHGARATEKRAHAMAVHEVVLSVGFIVGAAGGGALAQYSGAITGVTDPRFAYPVLAVLMAAVMVAQLWWAGGLRNATAGAGALPAGAPGPGAGVLASLPPNPQPPQGTPPLRRAA